MPIIYDRLKGSQSANPIGKPYRSPNESRNFTLVDFDDPRKNFLSLIQPPHRRTTIAALFFGIARQSKTQDSKQLLDAVCVEAQHIFEHGKHSVSTRGDALYESFLSAAQIARNEAQDYAQWVIEWDKLPKKWKDIQKINAGRRKLTELSK